MADHRAAGPHGGLGAVEPDRLEPPLLREAGPPRRGVPAGLERILALRARIAALEEQSAAAEREAAEIAADQGRLRENVKAVGNRRDARELVARWLARANKQEAWLATLREARRRSESERRALREEVDGIVRGLEGERRL